MNIKKDQRKLIFIFTVLPVSLILVFTYIPILAVFLYSFTDWSGTELFDFSFVGLQNYVTVLSTPTYLKLFQNTLWYMLFSIPQLIFGLGLAILLSEKIRGGGAFKSIILIPYLLNGVVVAMIFTSFFGFNGVLNEILSWFGIQGFDWLQNQNFSNPTLASISIWRYYGFNFIMFLAAIQGIPDNLYEASRMDGSTRWQEIKYIIIPSIRKILFINVLLSISGAIQVFEIPYIMTRGNFGTSTPLIAINQIAFQDMRVGLGAAFSVIVLIIVALAITLQNVLFKEDKDA